MNFNPEDIIEYAKQKGYPFYLQERVVGVDYMISAMFDRIIDDQLLTIIFLPSIMKVTWSYTEKDFDEILNYVKETYDQVQRSFRSEQSASNRHSL